MKCEKCEREYWLHSWDDLYEFCPHCGVSLEIAPEEFTHDWAVDRLKEGKEIEAQWQDSHHIYPWLPVCYDHDGCSLRAPNGNTYYAGNTWTFRLKPTPPQPEIVEWERCETEHRYFRSPDKARTVILSGLQSLLDWEFVNFTILLPNGQKVLAGRDHIWWNPERHNWSFHHETDTLGGVEGYTQRINAIGVNMLRRPE